MSEKSTQPTVKPPRKQLFRAMEAKSLRTRSFATRIADYLTGATSTPGFLFVNFLIFVVWIILNINIIPGVPAFDPYPFGFLTMCVSLEAIFLSIFVLVSQNRAAQIATLREELHLRINLIAEQEITKVLEVLVEMRTKMGIKTEDSELEEMIKTINTTDLEHSIVQQLERADQPIVRPPLPRKEFASLVNALLTPKK